MSLILLLVLPLALYLALYLALWESLLTDGFMLPCDSFSAV